MGNAGLNIMIPLGGLGKRFSDEGFSQPKPFVKVLGKELIFWVLDNLHLESSDRVYIVYHSALSKSNFEDVLNRRYPRISYRMLQSETRGAAETILLGASIIEEERRHLPLVCLDGDTFYRTNILDKIRQSSNNGLICFKDDSSEPIYSYTKIDEQKQILEIAEKKKISNLANTGCYFFSSSEFFSTSARIVIDENIRDRGEFYVSTVIKKMILDNHKFDAIEIREMDFEILGTPIQVKLFCGKETIRSENLRICFDLDNTLVTYPKTMGDYESCEPIMRNVEILRRLKRDGHTIIIYTARRMKTHDGDVGKLVADIGKITLDFLDQHDIPYDEIYFGKPYANFYIDDLSINPSTENLEKEMGLYDQSIDPRSFNSLMSSSIEVITKSSSNQDALSGEEFWYRNIPESVSSYFPRYFGQSTGNGSFSIEKIDGIPLTHVHLDGLLTKDLLFRLLAILDEIHDSATPPKNLDYSANYSKKVKSRLSKFDYSIFSEHKSVIENILKELSELESNGIVSPAVTHGDTVFTNILLSSENEFKFIDMRGELGGKQTIFGDKWYDFAKILQSIIGYDEILIGKPVGSDYRNSVRGWFEEYVVTKFDEDILRSIETITKSLLLSLIPLHDDESKQKMFFSLIAEV